MEVKNVSEEQEHTITKNEKQKQAILYAIQKDPSINRTKLMKYVFFIDLFAFNKFGDTILDDKYKCLPNGPVPDYGISYTDPGCAYLHQNDFQMEQVSVDGGKYYYYKFSLKPGVEPNTTIFKDVEKDLIDLTLEMTKSRSATSLSSYTHKFALWQNHECNGEHISLEDFRLSPDEMEELEQLLNTKIYVNSVNPKGIVRQLLDKYQDKGKDNMPKRLPVFIDAKTGDVIDEGE